MADAGGGGGGGGASLGKGAWDCDTGKAIPPEAEAAVFEEVRLDKGEGDCLFRSKEISAHADTGVHDL